MKTHTKKTYLRHWIFLFTMIFSLCGLNTLKASVDETENLLAQEDLNAYETLIGPSTAADTRPSVAISENKETTETTAAIEAADSVATIAAPETTIVKNHRDLISGSAPIYK